MLLAAVLAVLAVLATALALSTDRLVAEWRGEAAGTATLHVLADEEVVEDQARAALGVLRGTPGVRSVRMIGLEEQRALLEPWLGAQAAADDLPLPLLIEVSTEPAVLDLAALRARLATEAPGTVYDDHSGWHDTLLAAARGVRLVALAGLGLLAAGMLAVAGLAAHAAVAASAPTIETLRLVGARDGTITGAFAGRVTRQVLVGSLIGLGAGIALLLVAPSESEPGFFLAGIGPTGRDWLVPLLVLPASGLLAWAGARQAVRRRLRREH
jgi:cell division transport system permease protein